MTGRGGGEGMVGEGVMLWVRISPRFIFGNQSVRVRDVMNVLGSVLLDGGYH